jgi:hypothetical protein
MTLPPPLVAAVREAKGCRRGPALSAAACCGDCAEAIARSVLRAALTGEVGGPYTVECDADTGYWWLMRDGESEYPFDTEAEARAVANALHLLAALSGEEETR